MDSRNIGFNFKKKFLILMTIDTMKEKRILYQNVDLDTVLTLLRI